MNYDLVYQERLLRYYHLNTYKGILEHADIRVSLANPSCGDAICVRACFDKDVLTACLFEAKGCVISQATASLLIEILLGKSKQEIIAFGDRELKDLLQVDIGPMRMQCARLPLQALQKLCSTCYV
jgi:nitrogen fixation NifU-like protein